MNILKSLILTNTYITQKIQKEKTKIFLFKNRRNNVILSANNELHDIVGVWMAEGLLIKHEIFSHTLLNGEHKYDI